MAGTFAYLEDIVLADAAFEARGATLEELFVACAEAITELMIDPAALTEGEVRKLSLRKQSIEELLFAWLAELVLIKDAECLLFKRYDLKVTDCSLEAELSGCSIDEVRHAVLSDVKAVTYHRFSVQSCGDEWKATVVVDL